MMSNADMSADLAVNPELLEPPLELPGAVLSRICGGSSPVEVGEQIAAFILRQMFQ